MKEIHGISLVSVDLLISVQLIDLLVKVINLFVKW